MNGAQGATTATGGDVVALGDVQNASATSTSRPQMHQTLLSYDPPVRSTEAPMSAIKALQLRDGARKQTPPLPAVAGGGKRQVAIAEDILAQLFPPMQWTEDTEEWVQCVSSGITSRMDVITLQEQLDLRCEQRHALPQGVCAVREDLYEQCFDELIRQVAVTCAERGILLSRIRDETRMTIEAYKTMYDTACQLSMRQALQLEKKKSLASQLKKLEEEKAIKERMLAELKAKHEAIEKREIERRQADEHRHKEEVNFLKKTNMQLTSEMKRYVA
jgi:dynein light intermediate chain